MKQVLGQAGRPESLSEVMRRGCVKNQMQESCQKREQARSHGVNQVPKNAWTYPIFVTV